jgi:hypothetical protein
MTGFAMPGLVRLLTACSAVVLAVSGCARSPGAPVASAQAATPAAQGALATQGAPAAQAVDQAAEAAEAAKARLAQTGASRAAAVEYSREFYPASTTMQQRLDLLTPDYAEHGPLFVRFNALNQVQGREGLKLILDTLSRLRGGGAPIGAPPDAKGPRPPPGNVLYQVVADGNLVMVLNQQYRPDPYHKGKYYQSFVFDLFRVQDGKMAEHWDDTTIPANAPAYLREPVSKLKFPRAKRPIY